MNITKKTWDDVALLCMKIVMMRPICEPAASCGRYDYYMCPICRRDTREDDLPVDAYKHDPGMGDIRHEANCEYFIAKKIILHKRDDYNGNKTTYIGHKR